MKLRLILALFLCNAAVASDATDTATPVAKA